MNITKIGHCCLLIKEPGLTVLTDPGAWTTGQNNLTGIDVVLITHEHQDHFHIDSVKAIIKNNPNVKIVTNTAVGKLLDEAQIPYQIIEHGDSQKFAGILVEGFGEKHAEIYSTIPPVQNTGYLIGGKFFYPGDALVNPEKPVEILALPVCGPWLLLSDAIDYAKELKPQHVFPVHDGMLNEHGSFVGMVTKRLLELEGVKVVAPDGQKPMEF